MTRVNQARTFYRRIVTEPAAPKRPGPLGRKRLHTPTHPGRGSGPEPERVECSPPILLPLKSFTPHPLERRSSPSSLPCPDPTPFRLILGLENASLGIICRSGNSRSGNGKGFCDTKSGVLPRKQEPSLSAKDDSAGHLIDNDAWQCFPSRTMVFRGTRFSMGSLIIMPEAYSPSMAENKRCGDSPLH